MTQSRRMSLVEATTNTAIGYWVAVTTQVIAFPIFGLDATLTQHLGIGAIFLCVSLLRTYLLRRAFAGAWRAPVGPRRTRWHDHRPAAPTAAPGRTFEVD